LDDDNDYGQEEYRLRKLSDGEDFFDVVEPEAEIFSAQFAGKTEISLEEGLVLLQQEKKTLVCSLKIAQADIQKLNADYANLSLRYKWLETDAGPKGRAA
jgi:hypothetical protein